MCMGRLMCVWGEIDVCVVGEDAVCVGGVAEVYRTEDSCHGDTFSLSQKTVLHTTAYRV